MSTITINFNNRREAIAFFRSVGMTGGVAALEGAEAREQHQRMYELLCGLSAWFESNHHVRIGSRVVWTLDQFMEAASAT